MYISEEIVVEIMSWLPPESLIRFKCVSKSWNALINGLMANPTFVFKHLHNIKTNNFSPAFLIVGSLFLEEDLGSNIKEVLSLLSLFNHDVDNNHIHSVIEDLPHLPLKRNMSFLTTYHCDGIICQLGNDRTMILWNPALLEVKSLPKRCIDSPWESLGMGFGYDSRAHDYKIVSIASCRRHLGLDPLSRAEVYTLHTDCWREIRMPLLCSSSMHRKVYANGVCYWLVQNEDIILSFDMTDELFATIPLPDNLGPVKDDMNLMVWNDSVALLSYPGLKGQPVSIEIWMMNDCFSGGKGVEGGCSWSKYYIVGPLLGIRAPWMFWRTDELLMERLDGGLVSYNLLTQKLRSIATSRTDRISYLACSYVKSLVSVIGAKEN